MPLNYVKFEQMLDERDTKFKALFHAEELNDELRRYMQEVVNYYHVSYTKAKEEQTINAILNNYEDLITYLQKAKDFRTHLIVNQTDEIHGTTKDFLTHRNDSKYLYVIKHNALKTGKALFWASTGIALYACIYLLALPMLILQPVLGVAMLLALGGLLLKSAISCIYSFVEFKGFERHRMEQEREKALIGFFIPPKGNDPSNKAKKTQPSASPPPVNNLGGQSP